MTQQRESIKVLQECIDLQVKKSNDYQNPTSTIKQAHYYTRGAASIFDIMHTKMLRIRSVMEAMENDPNYNANFESIEDSAKDLINYSSFLVSFMRGKIDGQDLSLDFLGRPKLNKFEDTVQTYLFENGDEYVEPEGC
jgi:hypothetical protein